MTWQVCCACSSTLPYPSGSSGNLSLLVRILGHARLVASQTPGAACALTDVLQRRRCGGRVCRVRHTAICGVQLRGLWTTLGACAGLHGDVWLQRRGGVHRQPARIYTLHSCPRRLHVRTKHAHVPVGGCGRRDNSTKFCWLRHDVMLSTLPARQYNALDSKKAQCTMSSASAGAGPRQRA